ncbi:MAG: ATP-binding protein, partial [Acidimicrobiia bacterium]|nr:ATP-binding protein [Acidimicrobiia bacterium]
LAATLLVGILVSLRQVVAIHENRHHVERERKALISTISHELRTPLTAMVGFLDLINGNEVELSEEERGEMMEVVDQQARYLWRIVADLVLLARGKSDQIELEISRVDLREIVDRAATAVDTGMNDVRILVSAGLVATVDADRVQQALVNLLSNAVRYGGGQRALIATADRDDLVLEVHDDGPGVPKRYELAIWERFERGANRLNATVPGSGVGLAIVDAIARAHGGVTGYRRSEILGGACFSLRLPDAVVPVSAPASAGELPLAGSGLEEVGDTAQNRSLIR